VSGTVVTVGTFDGVHRGHQAVLAEIKERAGARGLKSLVVTFGFGRGRTGDVELLRRLGETDGFRVDVVEAVLDGGHAISSTLIRTALAHGNLGAASRWLGRPYTIRGVV
jgi:riboflavin kinase/FMN adenylyltransferase